MAQTRMRNMPMPSWQKVMSNIYLHPFVNKGEPRFAALFCLSESKLTYHPPEGIAL